MPVVDASVYCGLCGHAHRPGSRCKIRDGYGERCDCPGSKDEPPDEAE